MEKHIKIEQNDNYRIVAISDIHGGYNAFVKLIESVELHDDDYLFILGDFIQKGAPNSRKTISYIRELLKRERTVVISGNHERYITSLILDDRVEDFKLHLEKVQHPCIFSEWIREIGVLKDEISDYKLFQKTLLDHFNDEISFMSQLPVSISLDEFLFVHAGIDDVSDCYDSSEKSMLGIRDFMNKGHSCEKTIVVGHWPVQNYRSTEFNGKVYINSDEKIISIDGGYGVKEVGQVNVFIILKENGKISYDTFFEDDFQTYKIKTNKNYNELKVFLNWNDSEIALIEIRDEFSLCRKIRTNEEFLMKNEFIDYKDIGVSIKQNYISCFHNVLVGDEIRLINTYGAYCYVKYNGKVGWIEKDCIDFESNNDETSIVEESVC